MNRHELLNLLDLRGQDAGQDAGEHPGPAGAELAITQDSPGGTSPCSPANPTAFDLDDWALRRGREVLDGSQELQSTKLDQLAIADFHAAAFEPDPQLHESCAQPQRREFLKQLLETPDYRALHASTVLHEVASEIAACHFARQFAALKQEPAGGRDSPGEEIRTLRAVGQALVGAAKDVAEARDAAAALGMGPGAPGSNDPAAIAALYRRVRGNSTLRRICELAGRFRRVAQSRQRLKVAHGYDDMVGVVMDGDIGRLLPHELAKLNIREFEWDTLRRLVERQTMCRQYTGSEPVAKGPIIVTVDESGSMTGPKADTAKALALAMAWIARHQKRWCALVAYSGRTGERLLPLPPGRWDDAALMDWLEAFLGGGSDLDVPVEEMPDYYEKLSAPRGKTDVIFVTDAICRIPEKTQARFLAWKHTAQARVITLVVDSEPGDLAGISDEIHRAAALDAQEPAVERVLSI